MVVTKYLTLGLIMIFVIGVSFSLNWNVLENPNGILVYGYINGNSETNLNLKIIDGTGDTIFDSQPNFSSDYDTDSIISGVFYQDIELSSSGNYIIELSVGNQTYSNSIEFQGFNSSINPRIISISQNDENTVVYINITNSEKSDYSGNLTLYYKGGYTKEEVSIPAMSSKLVKIEVPTSKFGINTIVIAKVVGVDYKLFKNGEQTISKDFEVETSDISITKGSAKDFTFNIKNLDDYSITLNVNYDSNLNVYGEQQITLQPNEEKEVSYTVSVPRDFNDTPYLKITVSNGDYKKESEVNINLLPFEGFDLSVNFENQYLPNEEINTNAIVKNIGDDKRDIQFSYEVLGKRYLYPYKVSLDPGESFSFPVNVLIPKDQTTDFDIKFFVNEQEFDKTIEVTPYIHDFSIDINESNINILAGKDKEILLTIQNNGNIKDNYKISVNGWKYYTLDNNKVSISPKNKKEIKIDVITKKDMNIGNYEFNISVSNGHYIKYQNVYLFIDKPEKEQSNISFFGRDTQKFSTNKTFNYTLTIKNLGIENKDYLIKVSNFNITKEIFLSPNETKNVTLSIIPNEAKDYKFNITIFSNGVNIWSKELNLKYIENSKKITGAFIMTPREASIWGLVALSILGGAALGLYIGEKVKIRVNKEKAVISNDYR